MICELTLHIFLVFSIHNASVYHIYNHPITTVSLGTYDSKVTIDAKVDYIMNKYRSFVHASDDSLFQVQPGYHCEYKEEGNEQRN